MKKIFTLMLTLACALFVGVACTPNHGEGNETPKAVVFENPGVLSADGGSVNVNYTLTNEVLGTQLILGEPTAAWLTVELPEEGNYVVLSFAKNLSSPNSPAREASFTATYGENDPVTVTVKQAASTEVSFEIAWDEETLTHNYGAFTIKSEAKPEMLYLVTSSSEMADFMVQGETVEEKMTDFKQKLLENWMIMTEPDGYFVFAGNMEMPKEVYRATAMDIDIYAVGIAIDPEKTETDSSGTYALAADFATPIHVWKAPLRPFPTIVVSGELQKSVSSAAGSLVVDVKVENPIEGNNVMVSTDENVAWAVPTYADGKLTIAYEANTTALPRNAKIYVDYGVMSEYGYPETTAEQVVVDLTQEKDGAAEVVTFNIEVVKTTFNGIIVNVTPSNLEVDYYLNTLAANDWDGNPVTVDWLAQINNDLRWGAEETKCFKGALTNHKITMSPGNYEWTGYDFHVYAFALSADKSAPAGEASHILTTVDASDMPKLTLNGGGLVWNAEENRYDLTVSKAGNYTFNFVVENPVEGASVQLNGSKMSDNYYADLIGNNDMPIINTTDNTITLVLNGYPTSWSKSFAPSVSTSFNYKDDSGEYWGVQAQLKIVWVEDPGMQLPYQESFENGIGEFSINDVLLGSGLSYVWKHENGQYGYYMKASAYAGSAKESESWLVSPKIDLSAASMPGLQFSHCHKFAGTPAEEHTLWVKEWGAADWTQVTIPTYGTNTNYNFVTNAIDLSAWAGKKVQIGFKYISSTSAAGTWEIKDVVVYDAGGVAM